MIVLGANSDVAKAFTETMLSKQEVRHVYLCSSKPELLDTFKSHLEVKYSAKVELLEFDLLSQNLKIEYSELNFEVVFCASGYLGNPTKYGILDNEDGFKIMAINYSALVVQLNQIAKVLLQRGRGHIIGLSSVAGERGRQSNLMYGSAKAGFTAYLSGLRNLLAKQNIHVMTVKPGFMDTKMTEGITTPKLLTISAEKAAVLIYKSYLKKRNVIYISSVWRYIMIVIKNIPEFIFKTLSL